MQLHTYGGIRQLCSQPILLLTSIRPLLGLALAFQQLDLLFKSITFLNMEL